MLFDFSALFDRFRFLLEKPTKTPTCFCNCIKLGSIDKVIFMANNYLQINFKDWKAKSQNTASLHIDFNFGEVAVNLLGK